jgi:hypothetical protein
MFIDLLNIAYVRVFLMAHCDAIIVRSVEYDNMCVCSITFFIIILVAHYA